MSLEEKAEQALQKLEEIRGIARNLSQLIERVTENISFGTEEIGFTAEDKQKLLVHYQATKQKLLQLVEALP